jgi:hypothetical protein
MLRYTLERKADESILALLDNRIPYEFTTTRRVQMG